MKKIPLRTCIVCHNKFDKRELLRIVCNKEGDVFYDMTGKANGRGAYVCQNDDCIKTFVSKNLLERTFKQSIDSEKVLEIKKSIQEKNCKTNNL